MGAIFTYDLLVDAAVLLCVLSHRTTELLLGSVKACVLLATEAKFWRAIHALVKVVFLSGGSVVGVGVHGCVYKCIDVVEVRLSFKIKELLQCR